MKDPNTEPSEQREQVNPGEPGEPDLGEKAGFSDPEDQPSTH